jgi:hypothetical protein
MSVSLECGVLSGRGLCVGLITRPEESYRVWCIGVWSWILDNEEVLAHWRLLRHCKCKNKSIICIKQTNEMHLKRVTIQKYCRRLPKIRNKSPTKHEAIESIKIVCHHKYRCRLKGELGYTCFDVWYCASYKTNGKLHALAAFSPRKQLRGFTESDAESVSHLISIECNYRPGFKWF